MSAPKARGEPREVAGAAPANLNGAAEPFNRIATGDAGELLAALPDACVDLSFWSPPYWVGKAYETHLTFEGWKRLLAEVVRAHRRVLKPGAFLAVNVGDILCFPDASMPRIQADNVRGKKAAVTREDALAARARHPDASRHELARMLGCSEQTVQRRLEGNNVRGGKSAVSTRIMLTGRLLAGWAEEAGFYLYDRRVWHKDPCWANSRWHSNSYRAVDEFEYVYVFWNPGATAYDRARLSAAEWSAWGSRGVWRIRSVPRNDRHEAEFPEELAARVIRLFSPVGGVVLDPFVGSGTTTAAANRLGRRWIGFDADPDYARMARERTHDARGHSPRAGGAFRVA